MKMNRYVQCAFIAALFAGSSNLTSQVPAMLTESLGRNGMSDTSEGPRVTISLKDVSIERVLDSISSLTGITVLSNSADIKLDRRVSVDFKNISLEEVLRRLFTGTNYEGVISKNSKTILLKTRPGNEKPSQGNETGTISGRMLDSASQQPIVGATISVSVAGSSSGTATNPRFTAVTDENGRFSLPNIPVGNHQVAVRSFGYRVVNRTITVNKGATQTLNLSLSPLATSLNEVVTTVTGNKRRLELGTDIARINPDEIRARTPVATVTDLIEASQIPGVLVTRSSGEPGSSSRIRIRGMGSIYKSNDPLVIIDGVWLDAEGGTARMDALDPEMIESIEVVRGPSAATEYGQDAANGVIVITTKKGTVGPARWNFNYSYDNGRPYGTKPTVYKGWGTALTSEMQMYCPIQNILNRDCVQDSVLVFDLNHPLLNNEGTETNHRFSLALDGGSNAMRYSITASSQTDIGARQLKPVDFVRFRLLELPVPGSFRKPRTLDRRSIAANFTLLPDDKWNVVFGIQTSQSRLGNNVINMSPVGGGGGSAPPDWELDTDTLAFMTRGSSYSVMRNKSPENTLTSLYTVQGNWRPTTRWNVQGTGGMERSTGESGTTQLQTICVPGRPCVDSTGRREQRTVSGSSYTMRFMTNYTPDLGRVGSMLELRPAFGIDYRKVARTNLLGSRSNLAPGESSMESGSNDRATYSSSANATAGWYLNSTVGLFRRLYFDLGIRQDIGSAITSSSSTRYPKFSTSWLASDEPFWPVNNYIGMLRLRGAIGYAAVQPEVSDIRGRYVSDYEFLDGRWLRTNRLDRIGNPNLKPERAAEFEFGFDADVLSERVSLAVTYAHSINSNNLVLRAVAHSSGVGALGQGSSSRFENIAKVVNRNLEFSFDGRVIDTDNLYMVLNYNLTLSENKVARLGDGVSPFGLGGSGRIEAGYPIGSIWSRGVVGYFDENEDGLIAPQELILTDSLIYIGWQQPRHRAGYGLSLTVRNQWTFDTRFTQRSRYVQSLSYADGYIRATQDANAPQGDQSIAQAGHFGARPVSDIAWNSMSLTYQVPQNLLQTLRARSLQISLQGRNLNLWSNYIGRDPRVNAESTTVYDLLRDTGKIMPESRKYSLSFRWGI